MNPTQFTALLAVLLYPTLLENFGAEDVEEAAVLQHRFIHVWETDDPATPEPPEDPDLPNDIPDEPICEHAYRLIETAPTVQAIHDRMKTHRLICQVCNPQMKPARKAA